MGDTPSRYDEPLQPQPVPVWCVERRFCVNQEVTLRLREKVFSFSGDDYKVSDANSGSLWFRIAGRAFSIREKKVLCDYAGMPVLNMKETLLSLFEPNYKVYRGEHSEEQIFKLVAKFTMAKAKGHAEVINGETGQPLLVVLKGNVLSKEACIYLGEPKQGGIPVAKIYRPYTGREFLTGQQDYFLTVAPNVDVAMCVTITVAMDEMKKDNN